jgi:dihydrofolate reductase
MRRLTVFEHLSLDGYFVDAHGDMRWAYRPEPDPEWDAYVAGNASGDAILVLGRVTYDLMQSYWPTPMAMEQNPVVAKRMNALSKLVFSRTLDKASWENTRLVKGDAVAEMSKFKGERGQDMVILGSGSLVAQFATAGLIDEYQMVVNPRALGAGRTLFAGLKKPVGLKLTKTRKFNNGNVVLDYEAMA